METARRRTPPRPRNEAADWYRIVNQENADGEDTTVIYIYDVIGYWENSASMFVEQLQAVATSAIELHINSPGGDAYDGIAIYNALRNHAATVHVRIDALAASAASFIAMAGDTITIERTAQVMIHDATGICMGNSGDMRELADLLDKMSDNIAGIYRARAGGLTKTWRTRMKAESWYSASEAVSAGLADKLGEPAKKASNQAVPDMAASWDMSVFRYASRNEAPAPEVETEPASEPPEEELPTAAEYPITTEMIREQFKPAQFHEAVFCAGLAADYAAANRAPMPEPRESILTPAMLKAAFDAETFKAVVTDAVEHAPAPPDLRRPAEPEPIRPVFDPIDFINQLREVRL